MDNSDLLFVVLVKKYGKVCVIVNGYLEDFVKVKEIIEKEEVDIIILGEEVDIIILGKGVFVNYDWVDKVKKGNLLVKFDEEKVLRSDVKIKDFEVLF